MIDTDEPYNSSLDAAGDYQEQIDALLAEIRGLNNIIGTFDDFMCNNWTPENVHSLWNELLTKEDEE